MRTRRTRFAIATALAAIAMLTACGNEGAGDEGSGVTLEPTPDPTTTGPASTDPVPPTESTATPGTAPQDVIDQSIALLSEQIGVAATDIEVVRAIELDWRDGSIGCPEAGMGYTQALVPGSLVELTVDGVTYAFHQAQDKPPFYCANPTEPLPES